FSSRRRHTRFSRDWSSDVCSSDLQAALAARTREAAAREAARRSAASGGGGSSSGGGGGGGGTYTGGPSCLETVSGITVACEIAEIGRASCRERVEGAVGVAARKRR